MPREGPSSDGVPPPPEPLLESKGPGWIQVSVRCLVCEKKFKVWVPDTPQNEKDASETVMDRLKQHVWSVQEEHGLSEGQIKNMLNSVHVDVREHEEDDKPMPTIIRKRKAVEQPTDSMEDQAQPQPLITMSRRRWPGSSSSGAPSVPFGTGSEGMNLDKQDRARRYLSTLGTAELRDMVRLVMNEWQQRESRGI